MNWQNALATQGLDRAARKPVSWIQDREFLGRGFRSERTGGNEREKREDSHSLIPNRARAAVRAESFTSSPQYVPIASIRVFMLAALRSATSLTIRSPIVSFSELQIGPFARISTAEATVKSDTPFESASISA